VGSGVGVSAMTTVRVGVGGGNVTPNASGVDVGPVTTCPQLEIRRTNRHSSVVARCIQSSQGQW